MGVKDITFGREEAGGRRDEKKGGERGQQCSERDAAGCVSVQVFGVVDSASSLGP